MKNRKPILIILSFLILIVLMAGYSIIFMLRNGSTPPVITCDKDTIEASINADDKELLKGVSAYDSEDGDVSSSLVVEKTSKFIEKGKCKITYAAFDSNNNVAKATRTLIYTDYTSPKFVLKQELRFPANSNLNLLNYVSAQDCIDGDISDKVKMVSEQSLMNVPGTYTVRFRVVNSMGETAYLDAEVDIYDTGFVEERRSPRILLDNYVVYINAGDEFSSRSLIKGVQVGTTTMSIASYGMDEIFVRTNLDTNTPGTYTVTYRTSYEGYTGQTKLYVIVMEGEN